MKFQPLPTSVPQIRIFAPQSPSVRILQLFSKILSLSFFFFFSKSALSAQPQELSAEGSYKMMRAFDMNEKKLMMFNFFRDRRVILE